MMASDKGIMRPRGSLQWPKVGKYEPVATIRVARLKHEGNCDPEPLAWQRLAALAGKLRRIRLEATDPMDIVALDVSKWPIAAITGTAEFKLSQQQAEALKKYLLSGGTLIIDAAGGSREFSNSVEKEILPLLENSTSGKIVSSHEIYQSSPAVKINYRRDYAIGLGPTNHDGRLQAVSLGKRFAIFYSPEDLTAGLMGYQWHGISGYSPDTSVELMLNMLSCAAGILPSATEASTKPASRPSSQATSAGGAP